MARIRSIKPELPQDAKLARLSRETRYHFVLLWTQADDAGHFRASPRLLLGQLYPHDRDLGEAAVDRMNADLVDGGFIEIRQCDDGPIGKVRNWPKHQKIDRPSASHLAPQFASGSRMTREAPSHGVLSPESLVLSLESRPEEEEAPSFSPSAAWQPAQEAWLAKRLTTDAGRVALTSILQTAQADVGKTAIVQEIILMLNGERGSTVRATPSQMDQALSEYVSNGMSSGRWNAKHFAACVRSTMRAEPTTNGKRPTNTDRALEALQELKR